jgi:hypothetical protein
MGNRHRLLILPALAAIAAILAATTWALSRETPPLAVSRLPDGTVLRLEAVTLGPQHRLALGTYWQRLIAPLLPPALRAHSGATICTYANINPPALVFWTSWVAPRWASIDWARASVLDELGSECEIQGRPFQTVLPNGRRVRGWPAWAFPRRGKTVGLRISIWDRPGHAVPAAQFTVPNPTPGPHPTWTGTPPPITKRDGDLSFTLARLTTDAARPPWLPPKLRATPWTRASFRLTEKGRQTDDWLPVGLTITDATGNVIIPPWIDHKQQRHEQQIAFLGHLLPDREAWKLRVEFARTAHFAPADLWTVRGLAIRGGRLTAATSRHGVRLSAILRAHGKRARDRLSLSVELPSPVDRVRLLLLQATDEQGRVTRPDGEEALHFFPSRGEAHEQRLEITSPEGHFIEPEEWCENPYRLAVFPDARTLSLTFALVKSRFVEFMAKPSRMGT